jgi:hypothetical protein
MFEAKRGAQVIDKVEAFFTKRDELHEDFVSTPDHDLHAAPAWMG